MIDINEFKEERACVYKGEEYLVRDNGAVFRKARLNKRKRKWDEIWIFGKKNHRGYLEIDSEQVHRIVAIAFHGEPPMSGYIVEHIDTNRQNNRPSNLHWISKLENALKNEFTRRKIEYLTGVSIYEFLENPSEFSDALKDTDFSWMRLVTEEETQICLDNLKKLGERKKTFGTQPHGKMGAWIYERRDLDYKRRELKEDYLHNIAMMKSNITDSLTPTAKQLDWNTPTQFVCCPIEIDSDPIECYLKNLSKAKIFFKNKYGEANIIKYASSNNKEIFVINTMPSGCKNYAVAKITYENGYYLHTSLGSFFEEIGAEKCFVLAQGLEWAGEESFDDYC